jgi:hypothetical protein
VTDHVSAQQEVEMNRRISTIAAGALCLLAVHVGATGAATDASGARPNGAFQQGTVRIDLDGKRDGPQFAATARGRFVLSGTLTRSGGHGPATTISDRGTFVDTGLLGRNPQFHPHVRTLRGTKGTIRIAIDGSGHWRVTEGTKAYAGLRGRGQQSGEYPRPVDITMTGTLSR